MSFWAIILISIGVICIAVSLAQSRHSGAKDWLAVHKNMDDARIVSQLKNGYRKVDAQLGIQFGAAFIALGLLWQLIQSLFWI